MATLPNTDFEKNVFINCPFDDDYILLLQPLLFTILYLGFNPRIATERSDSGEQRIDKICELIELSKYSVHDLSRLQSKKKKEFYRLNMPFELGIDYGCRKFATNHHQDKKFLVLEKDRYDYAKAISDLSGVDIKNHNNEPIKIIRITRNWLNSFIEEEVDAPAIVWKKFNLFMQDFFEARTDKGFSKDDIYDMPTSEFTGYIKEWLQQNNNPIAYGLGSTAKILDGHFSYTSSTLPDQTLSEFNFTVIDGKILRDKNEKLIGSIKTRSPIVSAQRLSETIGTDKQDFISEESVISTDSSTPTIFTSTSTFTFHRGETILNYTYEQDVTYKTETILKGYLKDLTFKGTFDAVWQTDFPNGSFETEGEFEIHLR